MDFPQALRALAGNPQFMAVLPTGPMIIMTPQNRVMDIRGARPHGYVGKFSDYISIAWDVMTHEQFAQAIAKARGAKQDS